jgi:hypothetical protein
MNINAHGESSVKTKVMHFGASLSWLFAFTGANSHRAADASDLALSTFSCYISTVEMCKCASTL